MVKKTKSNKDEEEETTTETKQSTFKTDCIKAFGHSDLYLILNLTKNESKLTDSKFCIKKNIFLSFNFKFFIFF